MAHSPSEGEWVIQDRGSDVKGFKQKTFLVFPLQTSGIRKAELVTTTMDGEEVLLQHEFIVGNVTSCLVSLGWLYQGGWAIHKEDADGDLSFMSPGDEIRNPIEYKNTPFAELLLTQLQVRAWQLVIKEVN